MNNDNFTTGGGMPIIRENLAYWTWRAPSYSEINREELATRQHGLWKRTIVERISERYPDRPPHTLCVLEVGTGPGFFAILLAEAGYRVTAIDLTPSMLAQARQNAGVYNSRIDFMEMNAQALTFSDNRFDIVLSRNVTWNLPQPEAAYGEWVRVLKPGGLLINFDANWYHYLFDEGARRAYDEDRTHSERAGIRDPNVGVNFGRMEAIARDLPLSRVDRPAWDENTLTRLGMDVRIDSRIWERVWSDQEKISLASTPMFMVCGYKGESGSSGNLSSWHPIKN